MVDPVPIQPGVMLLGKYRVERLLGQGGMGVVVAVKHVELGELFAMKLLLPEGTEDPLAVERFLREARAAARLRGEHVTKVVDVGRLADGAPYMVMEHLSGSDLRRVQKKHGTLPVPVVMEYALQACEALAEAHAAGIVHRDIKPANLFLTHRPNGTPCIKVLDFGISKQITGEDAAELTRTGDLVGSPLYMSPEQLTRSRAIDTRSDIWSLGMVMYKLLTGKVPFLGDSLPEIIARVLAEDTVPPSKLRPELPPAVDAVIGRCLKKQPDERYARVQDLAADLRAILDGREPGLEAGVPSMRPPQASAPPVSTPSPASTSAPTHGAASGPSFGSGSLPPPEDAIVRPRSEAPTGAAWGNTGSREAPAPGMSRAAKVVVAVLAVALVAGLSVFLTLRFGAQQAPAGAAGGAVSASAAPGEIAPPATNATAAAVVTPSATADDAPSATGTATASARQAAPRTPGKPAGGTKKHEGIY
jgi:serine/threonine protein kinase